MVTHELTVFPDGRVDGSVSARNGDYKSHTLHFVLAEGLTGASAKLMVWNPGADKATVYDTAKGDGSCTGQDVTVTPVLWSGPGRTRLQLELLNSAGDVVWQSRQFVAVVEDGIPDDAVLPPNYQDVSGMTAKTNMVMYGDTFYGEDGRSVGTNKPLLGLLFKDRGASALENTIHFLNWGNDFEYYSVSAGLDDDDTSLYMLFFGYTPNETTPNRVVKSFGEWQLYFQFQWRRGMTLYLDGNEVYGTADGQQWMVNTMNYLISLNKMHTLKLVMPGNLGTKILNIIPYDVTLASA